MVTDVDDTLVPESYMDLNPEYFEVIRKLEEKGVMFVAASGRQKVSIKKVFAPIQNEIAYLADNGTDIETKDFAVSMKFEDRDYEKLAKDLEALGGDFEFMPCKPDWGYVDEEAEDFYHLFDRYGFQMKKTKNLEQLKDISKVSLYHPEGIPKDVEQSMKEKWSDKMDVCIAGRVYLDFTKKGCNKGKGIEIIQQHYGITPEQTVTFGNADNDISMIHQAKYGYAVGNASENLKKAAYETIGEMKEDAVLKKMKEILQSL
ncbi:MAG: Cof-type HAD-IIB family hydrolase [Eubacterium sp.]